MRTVTIIGCGAIKTAIAYELSKCKSEYVLNVAVLEVNPKSMMVATGSVLY